MSEIVDVPLADLLIDVSNARLKDEQASQQAALLALAKQQGSRLLKLANDIVEHGLDPTTIPAVVSTNDQKKRYVVLEGNRRVVALKALETPSLIAPALNSSDQKKLNTLAKRLASKPISSIKCVLFASNNEANRWIELRHTGQNDGVGLVERGSDEKDRYAARHGKGKRSPSGQVIDFVEKLGGLSDVSKNSDKGIITNVGRLISSPAIRQRLGIEVSDQEIFSWYPTSEVAKGLARIIEDLKTQKIRVGDIYHSEDRVKYAESISESDLPNPATRLSSFQPLGDLDRSISSDSSQSDGPKLNQTKIKPLKRVRKQVERTAVIPRSCALNIDHPRINAVYNELLTLSVDQYPNACSITLRVFVELSTNRYIEQQNLMTEEQRRNDPLAKRLKAVASNLEQKAKISPQLRKAIENIADSQLVLAASMVTFNQYVHNEHRYPKPTELIMAWDEIQPFMEKLWT